MVRRGGWWFIAALLLLAGACAPPAVEPDAAQPMSAKALTTVVVPTSTTEPVTIALPPAGATATPQVTPLATPLPQLASKFFKYEPDARPVAVVVENEIAARPLTGLGDADVVYEAVAEWNLTRFVAIYSTKLVEAVGPIRSGRAYHAAIAAEYDAAMAYCLGVPSVATVLAVTKVVSLDGCRITDPPGFRRDWDRRAPHNLYVNVPVLQKVAGGTGAAGLLGKRQAWPGEGERVTELSFVYPELHPVRWHYDASQQRYLRWQDNGPQLDITGEQLAVDVVVIQFVAVHDSRYYGEAGYHELTLTGEGQALVYANGLRQAVIWRRENLDSNTHFFSVGGEEVLLPPGRVFVQLVTEGTDVQETK